MKKLVIQSTQFRLTLHSFKDWLQTLGYSTSATESYPTAIQELLHYLEQKRVKKLQDITPDHLTAFTDYLKKRPNETYGGGLSVSMINASIKAVNKFLEYLRLTKDIEINVELQREKKEDKPPDILTQTEIRELFKCIPANLHPIYKQYKALLAVFYGAALRKSELQALTVNDILIEQCCIHVQKGKGGRSRTVPVTKNIMSIIRDYITGCRDVFADVSKTKTEILFINILGEPLSETTIYNYLKEIQENCELASVKQKRINPHTFRHSIATHLVQNGMSLEQVKTFLGHQSLDATSIYLHYSESLSNGTV